MVRKLKNNPIIGKSPLKVNAIDYTSENELQVAVVKKLRTHGFFVVLTDCVGPTLKFISDKSKRFGFVSWSKARGWEKGVTDLVVIGHNHTLFLELKYDKGKLSPEQIAYKNRVINAGYEYACWKNLDECTAWLISVLNLNKSK